MNPRRPLLVALVTCALLISGCGASQRTRLAYRLTKGDLYRYQYYEWLSTRPPSAALPATSLEIIYDITLTVSDIGRQEIRLDVVVANARARISDANGERDWHSDGPHTAQLYMRPVTGEITKSIGQILLDLPGTQLNPLLSLRQSLQQYPDKAIRQGSEWNSHVHSQLARAVGLSDAFSIKVAYIADETRSRDDVARLVAQGEGALSDESGRLRLKTDTLVSRLTGMPVEEQSTLVMESSTVVIEARSSLRLVVR